jgi:hypothetical protein
MVLAQKFPLFFLLQFSFNVGGFNKHCQPLQLEGTYNQGLG